MASEDQDQIRGIRKCPSCGQASGDDSWRLAGELTHVDQGACIYCLCRAGVIPVDLHRAVEFGRKTAQAKGSG